MCVGDEEKRDTPWSTVENFRIASALPAGMRNMKKVSASLVKAMAKPTIYAQASGRDPEFSSFPLRLQAYEKIVAQGAPVLRQSDSALLRSLESPGVQ